MQKYVEEKSKGWIQQGDERQPKVDVKLEIAKLNFCKSFTYFMNCIQKYFLTAKKVLTAKKWQISS